MVARKAARKINNKNNTEQRKATAKKSNGSCSTECGRSCDGNRGRDSRGKSS